MANAAACTSITMDNGTTRYGTALVYTTTHTQIASGSRAQNCYGSGFAYDPRGNVIGSTLNTTDYYSGGIIQHEVRGLAHGAAAVDIYLDADDPQAPPGCLFGGNDRMIGSSGARGVTAAGFFIAA